MTRAARVLLIVALFVTAAYAGTSGSALARTSAAGNASTNEADAARGQGQKAKGSRKARKAPIVRWRAPKKSRVVEGTLTGRDCQVRAKDSSGIARVSFYVDGERLHEERNAPWHCRVATTRLSNGPHELKAVAVDRNGNIASRTVRIEVRNPAPAPASAPVASAASAPTPAASSPAPAAAAAAARPLPAPAGWNLLKEWNFDTPSALSELHVYDGFSTSANSVGGQYKRSNVRVSGGELQIVGDGVNGGGVNVQLSRTYGRWEVRARMDAGSGAGPCILLWPKSDRWPADGEIDMMESPFADRTETHFTNHWGATFAQKQSFYVKTAVDAKQWHEYAVEWEAGVIRYYVDRNLIGTYNGAVGSQVPSNPMSLAMQVDGPNGWIPTKNAQSPAEMVFHIDSARVYAR